MPEAYQESSVGVMGEDRSWKIVCLGAGYVGAPTMIVMAAQCPHIEVVVLDVNPERIAAFNNLFTFFYMMHQS